MAKEGTIEKIRDSRCWGQSKTHFRSSGKLPRPSGGNPLSGSSPYIVAVHYLIHSFSELRCLVDVSGLLTTFLELLSQDLVR